MRSHHLRHPVILLQVNHQVRLRLPANLGQRLGVLATVDGDANHVGPRPPQVFGLGDRGVDIGGVRRAHALHGDRMASSDRHRANLD